MREESDDSDPPPQKIVRRGRPPGKKIKKLTESYPFECVGPESFSDTTFSVVEENEHPNGTNSYNLRKNPTSNRFRHADAVNGSFRVSLGTDTYPSWVSDWESEFPGMLYRVAQVFLLLCSFLCRLIFHNHCFILYSSLIVHHLS